MFSDKDLEARIDAANAEFVSGAEIPNAPLNPNTKPTGTRKNGTGEEVAWTPVDLYQRDATRRWEESKKNYPKGSPVLVKTATESIINGDGGLARKYKEAKDDSEVLLARGDKRRADILRRQYMQETFLPAVEAVVSYVSPDELLNCNEALAAFDSMALGLGTMKGYTASYLRQAYGDQLGQKEAASDPAVTEAVIRIRGLADDDEVRTAIGLAQKMKRQIDNGEHLASDDDYELISRVVSYAN